MTSSKGNYKITIESVNSSVSAVQPSKKTFLPYGAMGLIIFILLLVLNANQSNYREESAILKRKIAHLQGVILQKERIIRQVQDSLLRLKKEWGEYNSILEDNFCPFGIVIGHAVNIRSAPSLKGIKIEKAYSGEKFEIIDITLDGWYEIRINENETGYIFGALLHPFNFVTRFEIALTNKKVTIYAEPDYWAPVLEIVPQNVKLLIEPNDNFNWYKVYLPDDQIGWVEKKDVRVIL